MNDTFVELDRTFHVSIATDAVSDEVDLAQPFGRRGQLAWKDLLVRPRVVILSGGGSGKTFEIRHRARLLSSEGRPSFFVRIEHVRDDFAGAFDKAAGNHEQFVAWVKSGDEGWVFLDSVDEARLKSPKEFDQAIKHLGRILEPVLPRAHIILTGREAAWRARTDRELIRTYLPYQSPTPTVTKPPIEELSGPLAEVVESNYSEADEEDDGLSTDYDDARIERIEESAAVARQVETNAILIVGFDTLDQEQIKTFIRSKGVRDVAAFVSAVERKEAQHDTARPLDLEGLVDYWNEHGKIGNQYELTGATIARRLSEVDVDRAEATTLTRNQLRRAARALASASMLMQTPDIRLLDAPAELHGIDPSDILDWSEKDIRTLLLRPLFAASQFGAVRFYVLKAREFLTAEWLKHRLTDHASRARIEALFFRRQYGLEVVVPTMRGVLPWLALLDSDVLLRVCRVAPEVMFEGGDPTHLPLEMRRDLLSKACKQLAGNAGRSSLTDYQAVRRFAAPDLAEVVKSLLATYRADDEVVYFLMRMVWQGEIAGALDEAKRIASTATELNVRLIAMRAVATIGTDIDNALVREALVNDAAPPERQWVAEAVERLPRNAAGVAWLLKACAHAKSEDRYSMDPLVDAIEAYANELPTDQLPALVRGFQALVVPSLGDDDDDGGRGRHPFDWLIGGAIMALDRLVQIEDPAVFQAPAMALLLRIPSALRLENVENKNSVRLGERVAAWTPLNRALFWADVAYTRERRAKSGERVVDAWALAIFGRYWRITVNDLDYFEDAIRSRPLLDDCLVALSVTHALFRENKLFSRWRARLRKRVKGVPELETSLTMLLAPQSENVRKWRKQEARWKQRSAKEAARREAHKKAWHKHLREHVDTLRIPFPGGGVRRNQHYLSTRMREFEKNSSRWADGKWRSLIPEFGLEVAEAFRDGAVAFWRTNKPELLSDGAEPNKTPLTTIFGLTGLLFESREVSDWARRLSKGDAELAARYAMKELNGFPPWLPRLFAAHPESVVEVVLNEIDYELRVATAIDSPSHYVLADVSALGSWMWRHLAPKLLGRLGAPLVSAAHLRDVLAILAGSDVDGSEISALASKHSQTGIDELAAIWFAAWIGVEPDRALPAFSNHLTTLHEKARQGQRCDALLSGPHWRTPRASCCPRVVPHSGAFDDAIPADAAVHIRR